MRARREFGTKTSQIQQDKFDFEGYQRSSLADQDKTALKDGSGVAILTKESEIWMKLEKVKMDKIYVKAQRTSNSPAVGLMWSFYLCGDRHNNMGAFFISINKSIR